MSFEDMQREMALADVDGNGTIDWEEFTALMWELGKVEGAETLAAAMRTAYALGTKAKEHAQNIRHTQHRGGIGLSSTNPFAAQSSSILHGNSKRPINGVLLAARPERAAAQ